MSDPFTGGFGQFVPGFEFLRNLSGNAGGTGSASLPNLGAWVAPTLNVEELDKRIEELKAVQFWLDQNAKALAATIQALQVQKMTLSTLKSMNLNLGDVTQAAAQAWSAMGGTSPVSASPARAKSTFAGLEVPPRAPPSAAPAPAPARLSAKKTSRRAAPGTPPEGAAGVVDPMQWWGALTQQFQQIAGQAMQEAAHAASAVNAASAPAVATQKARKRPASPRAAGAKRPAARRA
jgi:hypothetical protein